MIISGIVAEYNPFHNGHLYQLNVLRETVHPDVVIAVISGDFLQRGEPAIVSKWTRTQMALQSGIDLVVELPYVFAVGKADVFARGAIAILDQLGVNQLFFSSESGRIEPFLNTLTLIHDHQDSYDDQLKAALDKGISYPNAHAAAYRHVAQEYKQDLVDLSQPNNSLGFHYIKAIWQRKSTIVPMTVQRKEAGHNDYNFETHTSIASASSIRLHLLQNGSLSAIQNKIPAHVLDTMKKSQDNNLFGDWERFFPFLKYKLLSSKRERLEQIYEMEEGIESRLIACIRKAQTFQEFISAVKTKRYTWARLQRLSAHILTDTLKDDAKMLAAYGEPDYVRLLGMSQKGQAYLSQIRKKTSIPLISKIRTHRSTLLDQDIKAAQLYDYLTGRDQRVDAFTETSHPPVRYDESKRRFIGESW